MPDDNNPDVSQLSDEQLLDLLNDVIGVADSVPSSVIEAAAAIHDWVDFDAEIARFEEAHSTVRAADAPLEWSGGGGSVRVETEESGWRRTRIICSVSVPPDGASDLATRVEVQAADGTRRTLTESEDGEFEADLAAGLWRLFASAGQWSLTTPWFRP